MNKELGLAVVGVAGFQVLQAWKSFAPSLQDVRNATPGDPSVYRQLVDADILVGGTALALGVTVAVTSGDKTALVLMLTIFGGTALWHHMVLNQEAC